MMLCAPDSHSFETQGNLATFMLSWVYDTLIGKFVVGMVPTYEGAAGQNPVTTENEQSAVQASRAESERNERCYLDASNSPSRPRWTGKS